MVIYLLTLLLNVKLESIKFDIENSDKKIYLKKLRFKKLFTSRSLRSNTMTFYIYISIYNLRV